MPETTPTHCFFCNSQIHNVIPCGACDAVLCSEQCLLRHGQLMHSRRDTAPPDLLERFAHAVQLEVIGALKVGGALLMIAAVLVGGCCLMSYFFPQK